MTAKKRGRNVSGPPGQNFPDDPLRTVATGWIVAALILATGLAYLNSLDGDFLFDDAQFTESSRTRDIDTLAEALDYSGFRRLTYMTLGLNVYFGGVEPFGFHLVNVLIHALNVVIAFVILLHLSGGLRYPSAAGALVFAVHPLFSGAVAYVTGRHTLLCGTFYFLAILSFLKALASEVPARRALWFSATVAAGLLAWYSKQEALALPVTLLAVTWIHSRKNWRILLPIASALALMLVYYRRMLSGLFSTVGQNAQLVSAGADPVLPFPEFFRTYLTAIVGYYFPRFVFPANLSADPYVAPVLGWASPEFLFSLAILAALGYLVLTGYRRGRWFIAGVVVILVSPLAAYALIPLADIVLEHRAYIPGLGIAILAGFLAHVGLQRVGRASIAAGAAVVLVFAVMTVQRNRAWADQITFWETTEADSPQNPRPHLNLGQSYQMDGRLDEAVMEYRHALEIRPGLAAAKANLASILMNTGRGAEAETLVLEVTRDAPFYAEGWVNLSALHLARGEYQEALDVLDRALDVDQNSASAYLNRGDAYTGLGEYDAALRNYNRAKQLRPGVLEFNLNTSMGYYRAGDRESAERELLALRGTHLEFAAFQNLGVLATDAGDFPAALAYFQEAARINPDPAILNAVGSTYMVMEAWDDAIVEFERVLGMRPAYGPAALNLATAREALGDNLGAQAVLATFAERYPTSPYMPQVRERLAARD